MFALDDEPAEALKAGAILKMTNSFGEHLATAVTLDGKDRWRSVVDLDKPGQKVVLIELGKVRDARLSAEREALQLQQQIEAKEHEAQQIRSVTQQSAEQREALVKQRKEIENQIDVLEKQAQQEETQANSDEATARQGQQQAALNSAYGTKAGNTISGLDSGIASMAINSAQQHRAKAQQMRSQIAELERKLQRLSNEEVTSGPILSEQVNTVDQQGQQIRGTAQQLAGPGNPLAPSTPPGQPLSSHLLSVENGLQGVRVQEVGQEELQQALGGLPKKTGVVIVSALAEGSRAEIAGLQVGDFVSYIHIHGNTEEGRPPGAIRSSDDFYHLAAECLPGCLVLTLRQRAGTKYFGFMAVGQTGGLFQQEHRDGMSRSVYLDSSAKCIFVGMGPPTDNKDPGFLPYVDELKNGYSWMFATVRAELVSVEMQGGRYLIKAHPTM